MKHILAESNWVVGCFAPRPYRSNEARALLEQARQGELVLHVPSVCLTEGATVIRQKFQPRAPDWHRFREEALEERLVTQAQNEALLRFCVHGDFLPFAQTGGEVPESGTPP